MDLLLIRHAETRQDSSVPSYQWHLTERAYAACEDLAERLSVRGLNRIITSEESKAKETGRVLAEHLDIPWSIAPNLHEHERIGAPYLEQEVFLRKVRGLLEQPNDLILGKETGTQARQRFDSAVREILESRPNEPLAVVTHASVMSLFVAYYNQIDVFAFWRKLRMPDVVELSVPGFELKNALPCP